MKMTHIPRRTFLRGLGTALALPALEAMMPSSRVLAAAAATAKRIPKRLAFVYVPNGANMDDWTPSEVGSNFKLPYILEPLKDVQGDLQILSGLAHRKAAANGDGAGDHARASATFLTGAQAKKTAAVDIRAGVSVDQIAATKVGAQTRLSSLELSCDRSRLAGSCDSGYACAYQFNISWKSPTTPMPPEADPKLVFQRLFGSGNREEQIARDRYSKSILDFVLDDAKALRGNLGRTDQSKLDEYLTSVRELEERIERDVKFGGIKTDMKTPEGVPGDFTEHQRLMYDLLVLAFQTDATRVSSFIVAHDGSNRPYPFIGVSDGHHDLSHHGNKQEKKQAIAKINRYHMENFAYFLNKLKGIKEGEGTLLDNCSIVYGSGISDGNRHNHNELPVILAGKGGSNHGVGRHVRYERDTPMTNLYLSLLDSMGVHAERLGDSTGRLGKLTS